MSETRVISDEQLAELIEQMDSIYSAKVLYGMYPVVPVEAYQSALRELQARRQEAYRNAEMERSNTQDWLNARNI